jgi:hypothetical protein
MANDDSYSKFLQNVHSWKCYQIDAKQYGKDVIAIAVVIFVPNSMTIFQIVKSFVN